LSSDASCKSNLKCKWDGTGSTCGDDTCLTKASDTLCKAETNCLWSSSSNSCGFDKCA
jgi:hypothetical protein